MPKLKTHSASKKRFKKNKNGEIKRNRAYTSHHAWSKTAKKIRHLRQPAYLEGKDKKNISKLLPN
ncbi:50S ribosomal protein L35 [Candidatus Dependentiae bacterium]|nr:50S ribosomal protein L35 [Candidatus Dependentiae bacterium]